jgi:hypothetical protein
MCGFMLSITLTSCQAFPVSLPAILCGVNGGVMDALAQTVNRLAVKQP